MRAFVITLKGHAYSEACAARCIGSARGIDVERFDAVGPDRSESLLRERGLRWTWGPGGAGLRHHPYGGGLPARLGCALSHFLLWERCAELGEPILILEHDAVFLRAWPEFEFDGICQVNDPDGATRRGRWWSEQMAKRGPGVFPATWVTEDRSVPDGLAGNSAYVIKPHAALDLIGLYRDLGVWPNDATMCKQLLPYLQECFPFITKVIQNQSTTSA